MTFTKEQLIARLESHKETAASIAPTVRHLPVAYELALMDIQLAELALAALEAEPDYIRYDCGCCGWETLTDWRDNDVCPKCNHKPLGTTELYTAPPAPVVPGEMSSDHAWGELKIAADDCESWSAGWNACRAAMQGKAEPLSQPYTLPPLDYLDTVKFNADCAIQDPESIYANEFFLSLDEVFGERGNYSEPVQAKAVSMLIAEVFRLRGYSPAAPQQEVKP